MEPLDLEENYTKAVLKYYKEIKNTDDRYLVNRELIEDAANISKTHLKHCLCKNQHLKNKNSDLLSRIQKITTEIEIIESEKASALLISQSANSQAPDQSSLNKRITIEDKIVKFKISKAELEQKLELLQENINQWKQELEKKHKTIQNLNFDLERYTEYRNSIQKVIARHMQSINNATSASSSFSYGNTARMLDNSLISERNISKVSNRSNSSIIID